MVTSPITYRMAFSLVLSGAPSWSIVVQMITLYPFVAPPFTDKTWRTLHFKNVPFGSGEVACERYPAGKYGYLSPNGRFPQIPDGKTAIRGLASVVHKIDQRLEATLPEPSVPCDAAFAHATEDCADEIPVFDEILMRGGWKRKLGPMLKKFANYFPGVC